MPDFVFALHARDLPDPGKQVVEIEDRMVALIHAGGAFYALDDVCTHDGGPLAEGPLDGFSLACPRHGAKFDVRTGAALFMPATRATAVHETKVEDGRVYVRLCEG